jgi:cytochrome P450
MVVVAARKIAPGVSQLVPGPFGPVGRFRRDPLAFLVGARRQYGDVFRMRAGPYVTHTVAHPDHVKRVLLDRQKNYPRSWVYDRTKVGPGEGLVTTEGAAWRRLRRMSQPAFDAPRVAAQAAMMTAMTAAMLGRWCAHARGGGGPLDVADEFMGLTLQIAGRALMGIDLKGQAARVAPAVTTALEYVEHRLNHRLYPHPVVPTPRNLRFRRAMSTLDGLVYEIIAARRREAGRDTGDLLSMLLAARDETTGAGLTDRELRDQVFTFLIAGYETTAVALAWTAFALSGHAEADHRLREEVAGVLGGRAPTVDDLPRLAYTRRVIEESLRLYPPVYAVARDAREDDEIGGYHIPAGSTIILSPYITHRHPEFWPDPDEFDPDRFTPDRSAGRPRFAWFPFLGGPHQCIGQEFAMMEVVFVIAMVAQAVRLRLATGARIVPRAMLALRPHGGVPMTVEPL